MTSWRQAKLQFKLMVNTCACVWGGGNLKFAWIKIVIASGGPLSERIDVCFLIVALQRKTGS